jgi:hypothetical protein
LLEQLGKNMNEMHKSHGGSKLGRKPNVERSRKVSHVQIFCDYFSMQLVTMTNFSNVIFECVENCFSKLWKQ